MNAKKLSFGKYVPGDSLLHRADPRIKILCFICVVILTLIIMSVPGYIILCILILSIIRVSQLRITHVINSIRTARYMILITVLINLLWTRPIIYGIQNGFFMSLRLCILMITAGLLMMTTSPQEISDAIERLIRPLKSLGLPTSEIALMISIAFRAVSMMADETNRIIKAQRARGARIGIGGPISRIKSYMPIIIPIFVSIFRRSDVLATAMEARCYNVGAVRTSISPLSWRMRETSLTAVIIAATVSIYEIDRYFV